MALTLEQLLLRIREEQKPGFGKNLPEEGRLTTWFEFLQRLEKNVGKLTEREAEIARNGLLSPEGRRLSLSKAATEAVAEFRWAGDRLRETIDAEQRLRAVSLDYTKRPKGADPQVSYLREREIRDVLRGRPQSERDGAFLRAAESGDAETLRALVDAPGPALVTPDVRQRGEESYGRQKYPEVWANLEGVALLREHLAGIVDHAKRVLLTMGGDAAAVRTAFEVDRA